MKNSDRLDAIFASVPATASAAKVTARGVHWEPEGQIPPGLKHWKSPPPMEPFKALGEGAADLTGKKWGRFTVVGLSVERAGGKARWVCRCACGDYEVRGAKTIKAAMAGLSPENSLSFQCYYCHAWQTVKGRYDKHGSKPLTSFLSPEIKKIPNQMPEAVVAEVVGDYETAVRVVAKLNQSGFRIVRTERSGVSESHDQDRS